MSTEARVPGVSAASIALNACVHVLRGREVLQDDRRSLSFVVQHLQARRGHAGRRPVGLLDAGKQPGDSLSAHVGEPDDAYVHDSTLLACGSRPYTGVRAPAPRARSLVELDQDRRAVAVLDPLAPPHLRLDRQQA
jgi:hypothetical protein